MSGDTIFFLVAVCGLALYLGKRAFDEYVESRQPKAAFIPDKPTVIDPPQVNSPVHYYMCKNEHMSYNVLRRNDVNSSVCDIILSNVSHEDALIRVAALNKTTTEFKVVEPQYTIHPNQNGTYKLCKTYNNHTTVIEKNVTQAEAQSYVDNLSRPVLTITPKALP